MNDILKGITVGELLEIDTTGRAMFEIMQHTDGGVIISVLADSRAVMVRVDGTYAGAADEEPVTKDQVLDRIRKSLGRAKKITGGGVIGEGKNPVEDQNSESASTSDDTQDAEPML